MQCKNCLYFVREGKDYDNNPVSNFCELYGVPYLTECPVNEDYVQPYRGEDNE